MKNLALTDRQTEAMDLHYQIKASGETAATAMVDFCRGLKKMRDEKLYIELGHETFEQYCEEKVQLGQSQAYTYIQAYEKLGSSVLQSTANLGITKLKLLSMINPVERAELVESGKIDEMSTREMEALVKKLTEKEEQLSLISEEKQSLGKDLDFVLKQNDDWKETVETLQKELKELKSRPTPVAVSEPDPKEMKRKIDEAVETARKKAVEAQDKAIIAARDSAKKQGIEEGQKTLKAELLIADKAKADALERAAELEKKLKLSENPIMLKFSFYFDALQKNFNELAGIVDEAKATDPGTAEKLQKAISALLTKMCDNLLPEPDKEEKQSENADEN